MVSNVIAFLLTLAILLLPVLLLFFAVTEFITRRFKRRGLYLNKRYVASWNKRWGGYELHFYARFQFFYSSSQTYKRLRNEAVEILKARFPQSRIIAITATLQELYEQELQLQGTFVKESRVRRIFGIVNRMITVSLNIRNWFRVYRDRNNGRLNWKYAVLLKRVLLTRPKVYVIQDAKLEGE